MPGAGALYVCSRSRASGARARSGTREPNVRGSRLGNGRGRGRSTTRGCLPNDTIPVGLVVRAARIAILVREYLHSGFSAGPCC